MKGLEYHLLAGMLILGVFPGSIQAVEDEPVVLTCQKPNEPGLYEQCQEIVILEASGDKIRAYSKPQKKVLNLNAHLVFMAREISSQDKFSETSHVAIPAKFLWNSSQSGFQSLCRVHRELDDLLVISCGRFQNEKINRKNARILSPYYSSKIYKESKNAVTPAVTN